MDAAMAQKYPDLFRFSMTDLWGESRISVALVSSIRNPCSLSGTELGLRRNTTSSGESSLYSKTLCKGSVEARAKYSLVLNG
jgi:hypothetical protein